MRDDELNQIADELTGRVISLERDIVIGNSYVESYIPVGVELMERPDEFDGDWEPQLPSIEESTLDNAGMDVFAAARAEWERVSTGIWAVVIRSGLKFELPRGLHLRAASRSGLGFKKNITTFPGTLDASYRGEFMGKLFAFSDEQPDAIEVGDKFVQLIPFKTENISLDIMESVDENTSRGSKGFGSTG